MPTMSHIRLWSHYGSAETEPALLQGEGSCQFPQRLSPLLVVKSSVKIGRHLSPVGEYKGLCILSDGHFAFIEQHVRQLSLRSPVRDSCPSIKPWLRRRRDPLPRPRYRRQLHNLQPHRFGDAENSARQSTRTVASDKDTWL